MRTLYRGDVALLGDKTWRILDRGAVIRVRSPSFRAGQNRVHKVGVDYQFTGSLDRMGLKDFGQELVARALVRARFKFFNGILRDKRSFAIQRNVGNPSCAWWRGF